mgnify:CR=1 FL=1
MMPWPESFRHSGKPTGACWQTLPRTWPPSPTVRGHAGGHATWSASAAHGREITCHASSHPRRARIIGISAATGSTDAGATVDAVGLLQRARSSSAHLPGCTSHRRRPRRTEVVFGAGERSPLATRRSLRSPSCRAGPSCPCRAHPTASRRHTGATPADRTHCSHLAGTATGFGEAPTSVAIIGVRAGLLPEPGQF